MCPSNSSARCGLVRSASRSACSTRCSTAFAHDSIGRATPYQLLQKLDCKVDLIFGDVETRREGKHVLVVAADIQHQAHPLAPCDQVALHSLGKNPVGELAVRLVAVFPAELDAERHAHPIRVADHPG